MEKILDLSNQLRTASDAMTELDRMSKVTAPDFKGFDESDAFLERVATAIAAAEAGAEGAIDSGSESGSDAGSESGSESGSDAGSESGSESEGRQSPVSAAGYGRRRHRRRGGAEEESYLGKEMMKKLMRYEPDAPVYFPNLPNPNPLGIKDMAAIIRVERLLLGEKERSEVLMGELRALPFPRTERESANIIRKRQELDVVLADINSLKAEMMRLKSGTIGRGGGTCGCEHRRSRRSSQKKKRSS
jgi:hypothetical protein